MSWLDRFNLTETERKGYVALLVILVILIFIRVFIAFWPSESEAYQATLEDELAVWELEKSDKLKVAKRFDPNTVADSIILSFRISDFAKKNWLAYRAKGRKFSQRIDVLKIYGMDTTWFTINQDSIIIASPSIDPEKTISPKLFAFNPNTLGLAGFLQLGFPDWLAKRIIKYREAGGEFKQAKDLLKIYDFPEELYDRIEPYVNIEHQQIELPENKKSPPSKFDLNLIDSLQLISIKGIGPTFASRIIQYRTKLGGYISLHQLTEVYGLDKEKVAQFENQLFIESPVIKKVNINQASFKALVAHPYLNYEQVKVLVRYRESVGNFKSIEDLQNLDHFTAEDIDKLTPYLSVE